MCIDKFLDNSPLLVAGHMVAASEPLRHLSGTVGVALHGRGQHVEVSGHGGKV